MDQPNDPSHERKYGSSCQEDQNQPECSTCEDLGSFGEEGTWCDCPLATYLKGVEEGTR